MFGRTVWTAVAVLMACFLFSPGAQAQIQSCGEGFELFIRNPDIVPDSNGVFEVSGDLMVQFQVIGKDADQIEAVGLSFGADIPTGDEVCDLPPPAWLTGVYLESYRADFTKEDGFFIPISTNAMTSPQMELGVAVHGYDAQGNELARFWGIVNLDHCESQPSPGCSDNPDAPDFTMPWMIILPGDGEARPVEGFAFEFNEELAWIVAELNGINITAELEEWTERPDWDKDDTPDGGPAGTFQRVAQSCTQPAPIHQCGPLGGPAYKWTKRAMSDTDVIRVIAADARGNIATKEIHVGSSVAGGTIADGLPVLQMTFESSALEVEAGKTAIYRMTMRNNGGGTGHPFASAEVPANWTFAWIPGHQPVAAGASEDQELHVAVPANVEPATYEVKALVEYRQGAQDKTLPSILKAHVVLPAGAVPTEETGGSGIAKDAPAGLPLGGLAIAWALKRPSRSTRSPRRRRRGWRSPAQRD